MWNVTLSRWVSSSRRFEGLQWFVSGSGIVFGLPFPEEGTSNSRNMNHSPNNTASNPKRLASLAAPI